MNSAADREVSRKVQPLSRTVKLAVRGWGMIRILRAFCAASIPNAHSLAMIVRAEPDSFQTIEKRMSRREGDGMSRMTPHRTRQISGLP